MEANNNETEFYMPTETLRRISELLKEYDTTSTVGFHNVIICTAKLTVAKKIYLASIALIMNQTIKDKLKEQLKELDKEFFTVINEPEKKVVPGCYQDTEEKIDSFVANVQDKIQKYLMPTQEGGGFK